MTPAISIRGLTKTYRGNVTALSDLSLDVPSGSVFGFLGPNGAGKTTAIRILAGLSHPDAGEVTVAGAPLNGNASYRRRVGYLSEKPRFYGWMTGRQALRYVAGFYPWLDEPVERRIASLLDLVALGDAADRRTSDYSGGMLQRLGIAQALVGKPSVLLLDEPVASLDPLGRREVLRLMQSLRGSTTVFYSTHILDDVERVADYVAILDGGRLAACALTNDLLAGFTRGRLRVELRAGRPETTGDLEIRLRALPSVADVEREDPHTPGASAAFSIHAREEDLADLQVEITRLCAAHGAALIENRPARLDLESVFVQLVDHQEQHA